MATPVVTRGTICEANGNVGFALMTCPTIIFECLLAAVTVGAMAKVMEGGCIGRVAGPSAALQFVVHVVFTSCNGSFTLTCRGGIPV